MTDSVAGTEEAHKAAPGSNEGPAAVLRGNRADASAAARGGHHHKAVRTSADAASVPASSSSSRSSSSSSGMSVGLSSIQGKKQNGEAVPAAAISGDRPHTHLRSIMTSSFFQPHPAVQRHRRSRETFRKKSSPSGICIAITSAPRPRLRNRLQSEVLDPWFYAERLLKLLDSRRAKSPLLERDMWAVVHASGCGYRSPVNLTDEREREKHVRRLQRVSLNSSREYVEDLVTALERTRKLQDGLAGEHLDALRNATSYLELESYVVPEHWEPCAFFQEASLLLGTVPPEQVAQDGWQRWLWRTKLAVDFVYVMQQCVATDPKFILLLQDDTTPARLWDIGIERFMSRELFGREPWALLSLYHPESYGLGFKHGDEYPLPCCAQVRKLG